MGFVPRYSTARVEIATSFSEELCAGNLTLMDAQVGWIGRGFANELDAPVRARMYLDEEDIPGCAWAGDVSGCFVAPFVHTSWRATSHELVHAVMWDINMDALAFFDEGLASAMQGTVHGVSDATRAQVYERIEWSAGRLLRSYENAGHFVRWLLETYGEQAVLTLYEGARSGFGAVELSSVFVETVGEPLDVVLDSCVSTARDYYPGIGPFACGKGEPVDTGGEGWAWSGQLRCSDRETVAVPSSSEPYRRWRRWSISVPADGLDEIHIDGPAGGLTRCLTAPADEVDLEVLDYPIYDEWYWSSEPLSMPVNFSDVFRVPQTIELRAGLYDLWIVREEIADPPEMTVRVSRM